MHVLQRLNLTREETKHIDQHQSSVRTRRNVLQRTIVAFYSINQVSINLHAQNTDTKKRKKRTRLFQTVRFGIL